MVCEHTSNELKALNSLFALRGLPISLVVFSIGYYADKIFACLKKAACCYSVNHEQNLDGRGDDPQADLEEGIGSDHHGSNFGERIQSSLEDRSPAPAPVPAFG